METSNATDGATIPVPFLAVGKLLLQDYGSRVSALVALFSAVVFGQFTAYLSQYLVVAADAGTPPIRNTVGIIVATNALMVISL